MAALDWSQCLAVESVPGKMSGAWVFRGTRMPVATVFAGVEQGITLWSVNQCVPVSAFIAAATFQSGGIGRPKLRSFNPLAEHPLAHIEGALYQFNALVFASDQEPNHHDVHQRDLAEIQNYACAPVIHCRSNAVDTSRLNTAAQL